MMEELIKECNIRVNVSVQDWKQAITMAGKLLVDDGDIREEYIQAMIDSLIEFGPYIVLTKGFAMAHAAPSAAVHHTAISVITLAQPVSFGSPNDPVSIVMCLSCTDKNAHMQYLQKIAKVLLRPGVIEQLEACQSAKEIYQLINNGKEEAQKCL